uniref:Calcineurin-like phosphoesterase domain-containing protein n=1 Tax=Timspurckia oligopyrenoides TaxID=708627 RepID=A0A7S0ZFP6_9RHOD|mmetsp:Transcript_3480/g.6097  ORF Transcript_3480/g.6097 Transcript_3480/m.6097 type:complete len:741 (+) Transcript_3480:25-2247(+)
MLFVTVFGGKQKPLSPHSWSLSQNQEFDCICRLNSNDNTTSTESDESSVIVLTRRVYPWHFTNWDTSPEHETLNELSQLAKAASRRISSNSKQLKTLHNPEITASTASNDGDKEFSEITVSELQADSVMFAFRCTPTTFKQTEINETPTNSANPEDFDRFNGSHENNKQSQHQNNHHRKAHKALYTFTDQKVNGKGTSEPQLSDFSKNVGYDISFGDVVPSEHAFHEVTSSEYGIRGGLDGKDSTISSNPRHWMGLLNWYESALKNSLLLKDLRAPFILKQSKRVELSSDSNGQNVQIVQWKNGKKTKDRNTEDSVETDREFEAIYVPLVQNTDSAPKTRGNLRLLSFTRQSTDYDNPDHSPLWTSLADLDREQDESSSNRTEESMVFEPNDSSKSVSSIAAAKWFSENAQQSESGTVQPYSDVDRKQKDPVVSSDSADDFVPSRDLVQLDGERLELRDPGALGMDSLFDEYAELQRKSLSSFSSKMLWRETWLRSLGRQPRLIVIGDVHGCLLETIELLRLADFQPGDQVVFTGDLVAKGPDSCGVVRLARAINAKCVRGNHDHEVIRWREAVMRGARPPMVGIEHSRIAKSLSESDFEWFRRSPWYISSEFLGFVFVHAGLVPNLPLSKQNPRHMLNMRSILPDGNVTSKHVKEYGWAKFWDGPQTVVFGHDALRGLQQFENAIGLDTGAVYGERLTALILPDNRLISVKAHKQYVRQRRQVKVLHGSAIKQRWVRKS